MERRTVPYAALALALAASCTMCGAAYGQTGETRFFLVTELGNTFEIAGPPPARLPGFDTSPYLNMHKQDAAISVAAGPANGAAA